MQKFRETNDFTKEITEELIWRKNFAARVNFSFFHILWSAATVWKSLQFSLTHFWQKFRESKAFTKEINKELIWRNIFLVRLNFSSFHTVCCTQRGKTGNFLSLKIFFIKSTLYKFFHEIFAKSVREFLQFPHCAAHSVENDEYLSQAFLRKSWKISAKTT